MTASALALAPGATADVNSYYDSLHAQGVTSTAGDQVFFTAGTQVCQDTARYIRSGGDWGFFSARRKAAENLALANLQAPREKSVIVANTAIDQLCPQYNYTWPAV
ncbi:MAG: hypothetical protein ACOYEV_08980 [Candidatus Nanopelagicales bacterium]